jgi:hypothetical protein
MLPELLQSANLFQLLYRIDIDRANQKQKAGCPYCGGTLHTSNYQRKPRGGPGLPESLHTRFSFCCSNEQCRRRTMPESMRFMDRRVYFRVVIVLVTALKQNKPQKYSRNMLARMLGANRKTISRWLTYFRAIFPRSNIWKQARGCISPVVSSQNLPGSLVDFYSGHFGSAEQALINCLRLLTTGLPVMKMMDL